MVDLALQVTLVILLLLTITWCVVVHHRLRRLRADRGEMGAFIAALGEATARAEAVVRQMHEANRAVEGTAQDQQRRARLQSEELARLMDNAVRVIKRLDKAVEQGATRVAELRTQGAVEMTGRSQEPPAAEAVRQPKMPDTRPAGAAFRQTDPSVSRTPSATGARGSPLAAEPDRPGRPARPLRREGQLDGLLHGELLEALQGLR